MKKIYTIILLSLITFNACSSAEQADTGRPTPEMGSEYAKSPQSAPSFLSE